MPFGSDNVQITYTAVVNGAEKVADLKNKTKDLVDQQRQSTETIKQANEAYTRSLFGLDQTKKKTEEVAEAQNKHTNALKESSRAIKDVRQQFFTFSIILGSTAVFYKQFIDASDAATASFERLGQSSKRLKGAIGDALAPAFNEFNVAIGRGIDLLAKFIDSSERARTAVERTAVAGPAGFVAGLIAPRKNQAELESLKTTKLINDFTIERLKAEGSISEALNLQLAQKREQLRIDTIGNQNQQKILAAYDKMAEAIRFRQIELEAQSKISAMTVERLNAEGDIKGALEEQLRQRRKLLELDSKGSQFQKQLLKDFDATAEAMKRAQRLQMLGIDNMRQIGQSFAKDVTGAFEKLGSDPLFKFLQGEKQSFGDIFKGFQTNINRAVSDAFGKTLKLAIFGGGDVKNFGDFFSSFKDIFSGKTDDKTSKSVDVARKAITDKIERTNELIAATNNATRSVGDCVCFMANNFDRIGGGRGPQLSSISIEQPSQKSSIFGKLSSIFGAVGSIASLGAGLFGGIGGIGSLIGGGAGAGAFAGATGSVSGALAGGSSIGLPQIVNMADLGFKGLNIGASGFVGIPQLVRHSGGSIPTYPIPKFQTGGEVPAMVQPGEFIVRKSVAQDNKQMLRELNASGTSRRVPGTQNVFLIKANDAQSFTDMLRSPGSRNQIVTAVIREIMTNGDIRRTIKDFAK